MNGPVVGAIITASVALVVAVGGAVRGAVRAAVDRRYERRRSFMIDAQDAMLVLREALAAYGDALQDQFSAEADVPPGGAPAMLPNDLPGASSSFVMRVPSEVSLRVTTARGRLAVARSRLEDDAVDAALGRWGTLAQASLIDPHDTQTSAEESAFHEVNTLIRSALRSTRGKAGRRARRDFERRQPVA